VTLNAMRTHGILARSWAAKLQEFNAQREDKDASSEHFRDYFRLSDTAECPRKNWLIRWRARPTDYKKSSVLEVMRYGDVMANWFRGTVLPSIDVACYFWEPEIDMRKTYDVGGVKVMAVGRTDGLIVVDQEAYTLEVKSTSMFGYKGTIGHGFKDLNHYSGSYITQANNGCCIWQDLQLQGIVPKGFIVVVINRNMDEDKETGVSFRDFWFEPSRELFNQYLAERARIEVAIQDPSKEPPRLKERNDECGPENRPFCPWTEHCWNGCALADRQLPTEPASLRPVGTSSARGDVPAQPRQDPPSNRRVPRKGGSKRTATVPASRKAKTTKAGKGRKGGGRRTAR